MNRKNRVLILLLLLGTPFLCLAQEANFPIAIHFFGWIRHELDGGTVNECQLLDSLRINQVYQGSTKMDVYHNICQNTGRYKMVTDDGPTYDYDSSSLWWGYINPADSFYLGGWADSLPDTSEWHGIIREHLTNIKDSFLLSGQTSWAGIYFDEYKYPCAGNRESTWTREEWCRVVDTIFNYISWAWHDAGMTDYDCKKIYSAPIWPFAWFPITFEDLALNLKDSGINIFECDVLRFSEDTPIAYEINYIDKLENPEIYSTNDALFDIFQQHVDSIIMDCDTCWTYFEKSDTTMRWYSINQTCCVWRGLDTDGDTTWYNEWRWMTKEEIRLQGWIALSRGAKGIRYYTYTSNQTDAIAAEKLSKPPTGIWDSTVVYGLLYDDPAPTIYGRIPRSKYAAKYYMATGGVLPPEYSKYDSSSYDDSAAHRIYDWVKDFNDQLIIIDTLLATMRCAEPFSVKHDDGSVVLFSSESYVKNIYATDAIYHERDYFEAANFKMRDASNDTDYFMVVNRYCMPIDTVQVITKLNYRYPYYLYDVSEKTFVGGQKPSRDTLLYDSLKMLPGGGILIKVIPDTQVSNFQLTQNVDTTFKEYYSVGNISARQCTIKNNSNVRLTSEDGSITLESNFTVEPGATLLAQVVPHLDGYYQGAQIVSASSSRSPHITTEGNATTEQDSIDSSLPKVYALSQNYPNPINGRTTFKYQLPKRSSVRFRIYNITGQLVKQYDMGTQPPGYYSIKWDAGRIANGVYFYKLNASSYQSIKKMVVLK